MLTTRPPSNPELERMRALCDPNTAGDYLCAAFAAGPEAYVIAKDEVLQANRRIAIRVRRITYH